MCFVDKTTRVAALQEGPDVVVVLVRHCEIAVPVVGRFQPVVATIPIHPVSQTNGLVCLDSGKFIHALLAQIHKLIDAGETVAWHQIFNITLGLQAQFFFNFDFDP